MGCVSSKPEVDPPPYQREAGSADRPPEDDMGLYRYSLSKDLLGPPKESPATKITCLQCYICGKQFQNDKVSIEAHYVFCDEIHQTPHDWDKYGVVYDRPNKLKRRCRSL